MSAISCLGQRQQSLLKVLLHNRKGLTVDELSNMLEISRNAVNQHLVSLGSSGYIQSTLLHSTGGRPSSIYTLTSRGLELFPRHYSFLAKFLLSWFKKNLGEDELKSCLQDLGEQFAQEFSGRVDKQLTRNDKINEVIAILGELGYDADITFNTENYTEIIASNCVFHKLAEECHGVCTLDVSFLASLLNADIEHKQCIVKGDKNCCFGVSAKIIKHTVTHQS